MRSAVFVADCDVGKGVFAAKRYTPGDLILVFRGPRVNGDDPVGLSPLGANLLQTGKQTYIFPDAPGLFVNHSCNPNAGIVHNRRLIALREIPLGAEIRFDYSTTMDDGCWTMECKCGDPSCRYIVTDFRFLPDEVRSRYLALGVVQGFIARRYRRNGQRTEERVVEERQAGMLTPATC